jgi:hypothetical protein
MKPLYQRMAEELYAYWSSNNLFIPMDDWWITQKYLPKGFISRIAFELGDVHLNNKETIKHFDILFHKAYDYLEQCGLILQVDHTIGHIVFPLAPTDIVRIKKCQYRMPDVVPVPKWKKIVFNIACLFLLMFPFKKYYSEL